MAWGGGENDVADILLGHESNLAIGIDRQFHVSAIGANYADIGIGDGHELALCRRLLG